MKTSPCRALISNLFLPTGNSLKASAYSALIVFMITLGATLKSGAAPHPATSTSALVDPEKGLSYMAKGFSLKTAGTTWAPVLSVNESLIETARFAPKEASQTGSLSVRMDRISANVSLETYAKKFMRDYPNYGFDVLGSKSITINQSSGLVVDMIQKQKNKQLRQVILKNKDQVAILTCLDEKTSFIKTISSCNQIMKSFQWTESSPNTPEISKDTDKSKVN